MVGTGVLKVRKFDANRSTRLVSKERRRNPHLIGKAEEMYKVQFSLIRDNLRTVQNGCDMNKVYEDLVACLNEPFIPRGRPPKTTARPFWLNKLAGMSRERGRLFHLYLRTQSVTARIIYQIYDKKLKSKARKEKKSTLARIYRRTRKS